METWHFHKRNSRTARLVINFKHTLMSLSTQEPWSARYERCMAIIFTRASPTCIIHHTLLYGLFMSSVRVKSDLSAMKTTSRVGRAENSSGSPDRQSEGDAFFCQPPQSHHLLPSLTFIHSDDTLRSLWWASEQQKVTRPHFTNDCQAVRAGEVQARPHCIYICQRKFPTSWGEGGEGWLKCNSLSLSGLVTCICSHSASIPCWSKNNMLSFMRRRETWWVYFLFLDMVWTISFLVQSVLGIDDEMRRLVSTDPLLADFQAVRLSTVRLHRPETLASGPLGNSMKLRADKTIHYSKITDWLKLWSFSEPRLS